MHSHRSDREKFDITIEVIGYSAIVLLCFWILPCFLAQWIFPGIIRTTLAREADLLHRYPAVRSMIESASGWLKGLLILTNFLLVYWIAMGLMVNGFEFIGHVLNTVRDLGIRILFISALLAAFSWVYLAGSHHPKLDAAIFFLVLLFVVIRGRQRLQSSDFISWSILSFSFLALFWILSSVADLLYPLRRVPLVSNYFEKRNERIAHRFEGLRIGLALSGGGYRAALMHAGVLATLEDFGVRVTHISSVSGGSILAAFYASGGSPEAFVQACRDHRFRSYKDITDVHNLLRLPFPGRIPGTPVELLWFHRFGRSDVQSASLRRTIWGDTKFRDLQITGGPEIILCSTDLISGSIVGLMPNGVLFKRLPAPRERRGYESFLISVEDIALLGSQLSSLEYLPTSKDEFPGSSSIADLVTASGAFPGAFNPVEATLTSQRRRKPLKLRLVDGGLRDNSGLEMLYSAQAKRLGSPGPNWNLDCILASDGSEIPSEADDSGSALGRALDIVYSNNGTEGPLSKRTISAVPKLFYIGPQTVYGGGTAKLEAWADAQLTPYPHIRRMSLLLDSIPTKGEAAKKAFQSCLPSTDFDGYCQWKAGDPGRDTVSRIVHEDFVACIDAFNQTSTLEDQLDSAKIDRLFRLGRYLVTLQWSNIAPGLRYVLNKKEVTPVRPGGATKSGL